MEKYQFTKKDTSCAKAIAIMLMLAHHLFAFPDKLKEGVSFQNLYTFSNGQTLEYFIGDFGKICVAMFIVLSGYGMYKSFHAANRNYTQTIIRRIKKLYLKVWQVFIVFVPIGLILHAENISTEVVDWIKNFFVLETSFNNEWWFLVQYMIIIVMLPFLFQWLDRKKANPWTDIFYMITGNVLFYTVIVSFVSNNSYLSQFSSSYYWGKVCPALSMVPMFLMGAYIAKYQVIEKILKTLNKTVVIKMAGLFGLWVVVELRENWQQRCQWGWDQMDCIYATLLIIVSACLLDQLKYVTKLLDFIGQHSTGIWLIHSFFCYYYCQEFIYALKNPILIWLWLLVVSLATDCLLTWLFQMAGKICRQYICKEDTKIKAENNEKVE